MVFFASALLAFVAVTCHGLAVPSSSSNELVNDQVLSTMRLQSAQLTEISLSGKTDDETGCLKRMLCSVGVQRSGLPDSNSFVFPKVSLGRSIEDFKAMLEAMTVDITKSDENAAQNFPKIFQILGSFKVGHTTGDQEICEGLFKCSTSGEVMIEEAYKSAEGPLSQRGARATCKAAGVLCPGISIGCALCSIFSPGTCGNQCITAGLYCGTSGYACKLQKN